MAIDVVPSPRIDHLVTGLAGQPLRRTDYHGVVWFGGRQQVQAGGMMVMRGQTAAIVSPFWLPDSLTYRSDAIDHIVVSGTASVLYIPENCALADVSARLGANPNHQAVSHVVIHLQGAARIPLGVAYSVTVLAPPDAVLTQ